MAGFPNEFMREEIRTRRIIINLIDKIGKLESKLSMYSRRYYALRTGTPVDVKVPSRIILSMLDFYKKPVTDDEDEHNENDGSEDI